MSVRDGTSSIISSCGTDRHPLRRYNQTVFSCRIEPLNPEGCDDSAPRSHNPLFHAGALRLRAERSLDHHAARIVGADRRRRRGRCDSGCERRGAKSSWPTTRTPPCIRRPNFWPATSKRSAATDRHRESGERRRGPHPAGHAGALGRCRPPSMQRPCRGSGRATASSTEGRNVWLVGSNPRGTAFAAYTLSERLGIDPIYIWTGYRPEHRDPLVLKRTSFAQAPPDLPLSRLLPR